MIMSLEPRMLFDGAVAATVADTAAQADSHSTADAAKAPTADHPTASKDTHGQADATPAASPIAVPGQSVVFVDSRVKEADSLLQGVAPGTQVVKLDAGKDGLQQIADYLDQHQGVSSVQIIAHGNAGDLWLGDSYLSADNVAARSAVLAQIGKDINAGGDILIYGCYTAEGERGLSFVDSLAQMTGRDVAASSNRTGVGGDWDLEIVTGNIESANVLSTQAMSDYQWGLATWTATNNANTGVGSLRAAIASAQNGDLVTFNSSMTVQLTSELLINKNITVDGDLNNDGAADVILDGQYRTRVIEVASGSTVTLDGLVITRGLVSGTGGNGGYGASGAMAGGIFNAGILTLKNVTVTSNGASGGGGGAGGYGGGYDATHMGGRGGTTTGGAGGVGVSYYSNGGNGSTATNGTISIGGGGGGAGWDKVGGAGGNAVGGIYNASSGTITIIGTSTISNNIGAGGGGGGGGGQGSNASNGGVGGRGVGAIWNKGTLLITAANFAALAGNAAASGAGGTAQGGGTTGTSPTSVATIYNDGGVLNTAYSPPPTATIVVADTTLSIGETSLVTITFSEVVTGFTNADLTIANGTLTAVSSGDGGITWTATFTPTASLSDTSNVITLDNTGVINGLGTAGVGVTNSNNYAIDTVRPTATIVVADTALRIGETSLVTITFNEAVSGFTNADLTIANGTLTAVSSSNGGITWTATFTPTASITDTTNVITLDNTGVSDLAGNAGSGTTDSNNYAIDTVRPTATIVVTDTALRIGETSLVTITFSEAVSGFTNADLTIANGTLTSVSSSDGGITWTATFTPNASINDTTNLITLNNTGVSDLSGNAGSGTTDSNNYAIDTLRPTATIVVADTALRIGETSLVTITFSEAVSGFTNADLTITNGTLTSVSSSDGGITWTATFTPSASITDTTNLITLDNTGVADLAGNAGSGTTDSNNYAIDTVRPTATIVVADTALRIGETSLVTITFSEAVSGFTNADLTITNGTLTAVSSSNGGITWTATFTPSASINDTTNLITLDNTGVSDLSGNAGSGTTDSNNYAIDTVRPTATIVLADTTLTAGETSLVTITFSEAVTGFTNADLSVANGTLTSVSSSDGGITWTATFTPTAGIISATNVISLANTGVADLAGNTGSGISSSGNYAIDTAPPTATIVVSDTALRIGETSLVTITFNQAVSGFTNADLTIANGTLTSVSSSDGGITWTATFTPTASINDTTNLITLDNTGVQAAASGNAGSGTTDSNNYAIDTVRPTATIVVADTALRIGETSLVTITFSEAVSGFTNADLTITNGTLTAVSSSNGGITWTATFTPSASINDTTNLITLDNTGVSDLSGNAGSGTTDSNNYAIDTVRPTATIVLADTTLTAGETSLVTITFSEAVSGFTNADLSVANGTLTSVSSSDGGITWTATFTPTAGIISATNVISLANTGVADLAGNTGSGISSSGNYAIDTAPPTATIVVADTALRIGETSLVTITFNQAVSGFTNADLTIANGTLTSVSSSDGGITWTATFTPIASITDTTNLITLDNTGVQAAASGNVGSGTTDSNNYAIDTVRPTATIVVADTALRIGETSLVTITFSEAVSGFTNADLTITNGTLTAVSSSDGGITWTATFTPSASISDTTNLITLDNTGVSDLAGNAGSGTTDSNNYAIDTVRPTATIVLADTTLSAGETSLVTITFSEAVSGFTNADLIIANGTLSAVSSSDGGITWTATFTPTVGVNDSSNVITLANTGVTDVAGNTGSGTTNSGNYTIDTVLPTATIAVADTELLLGETSLVTITFSEAVSGFSNADLSIANGTLSIVSSSDGGITWTATFTPTNAITDTSNVITLDNSGVQNGSGNAGSGTTDSNNYAIDTVRPTANIVVVDDTLAIGETSLVTITFSEAVSGFTNADLTVANGTLSNVSSSDGGITWTATFTPSSSINDTTNLITLNNTGVSDLAGNAGSGTTDSNNYAIDTLRPTATIVLADTTLSAGETSLVTITFSEAVSGFSSVDLSVPNGTLSAVSSSDGGITWTATFTPTLDVNDTTNLITLDNAGVSDLAGNAGTGTTNSANFTIDTVLPTATIVVADNALSVGETTLVTITFSEAVSGFSNADLSIANGTLSAVSSSDGGITWTATFTPTADITNANNLITLDNSGVQNISGNAGSGTTDSNNYAIDTVRPTATIVVADTALAVGETSVVTITFSEAVTGFSLADLTVSNGTLSNLSTSDNITYTATFTPTVGVTDTSNLITLDNSGVIDGAGNVGSGTTDSNNYAVDSQRPTATIVMADSTLIAGETTQVTITFSEAVSGFTNADLSVPNGTLSAVSSSDGGITWTATFTPNVTVNDTTNLIILDNSAVADLAGNAGSGTSNSANFTIDTVLPTATIVVADNALNVGESSLVTITFSEAVSGFSNADLTIANGALSAVSSSDGGVTWTATFTPTANITDAANLIILDNSGVQNASGNAGSGTTDSNNYAIDTQRPIATIVVADNALSVGETTLVTITFSEAVSGFTNADLTIDNGTLSAVSSSDGGITWTATLTPLTGIADTSNLIRLDNSGVQDAAGNAGSGSTDSNNYAIDSQRPTATIVMADTDLRPGETTLVTISFNEAVSGLDSSDLSVANGTLSGLSSSDGGVTWTATFTPTASITDTSNLITLDNTGVTDAAGNAGNGVTNSANYLVQTSVPTASIVIADTALKAGETSLVTITFSEAVNGFSNADLILANGTLSNVSSIDGGITWTATFTPTSDVTDASNLITLDNSGVANGSGNAGSGTTDSNNFAIDTALPTATIVVADTALSTGETSLVTITFSEAVSGFDNSDLTIANGILSNVSSSDGGITWTATLTPTADLTDTSNTIALNMAGVQDVAGNAGSGTVNSNTYTIDTQGPTATIVVADGTLAAGESTLVTITFSEAVSGFTNADLSIPNGTLSAVSSSDGGVTWTATFTPTANVKDTTNLISLSNAGVSDLAGNAGTGISNSASFTIDTVLPTATIVVADTQLGIGETTTVTITFSEAVSGFDVSDISVANGVLSNLSSSDGGVTWTATLTPTANVSDATNLIVLDTGRVQDNVGNFGASIAISNNYALDATRPTVSIVVANPNLGIGQTTTVTFTFSEAVSNFDLSDLSVTNGDLSNLGSSDGGKTWTATFTPTANVTDPSNFIALDTRNVTDLVGNTGNTVAVSNNYTLDSELPTATVVIANPNLGVGQTSQVTITFSEAVSGFDLSDISIANGTLSDLSSSDGGKTWTAMLTPTANVNIASNAISINRAGISDMAGNSGSGVSQSDNFVINTVPTSSVVVVTVDPEFQSSTPVTLPDVPNVPLQPSIFTPPTGNLTSPLTFQPLFEQRVIGNGIRPLGDIFMNHGALTPSFIAQVFSSTDGGGDGSGHGFLGFGGGDGGVFSTSTLSSLFNQDSSSERDSLNAFGSQSIKSGDVSQGLRGVFGAPTLGQQLQQLKDNEQQQVANLAAALKLAGIGEMQA
ncbi:Ig-like domain-containing protein [Pseudomonas monachiensis]|uniref:Ig-like domain-containing protein n=1 Tax=Pseudomonas monachiensis TaxID=3060212 RepID=A0ABW9HD66_9PSED